MTSAAPTANNHTTGSLQHALHFFSKHPHVMFIHYHWTDMSGVLRVRVVPKAHSLKLASENRPFKAGAFSLIGLMSSTSLPNSFRPGSVSSLWPDWISIRILRHTHASVFCDVSEEAASHTDIDYTNPFQRCPRSVLKNVLFTAKAEHQLSFLAGFELEFYLMNDEDFKHALADDAPKSANCWSTASGMRDPRGKCLEECVVALQEADIEVEQFHAEPGRHMYEISTGPLPVLAAVDTWNQSLEIVKYTAVKCGFQATFLPKPFGTLYCLGQHVHLSLHPESRTGDETKDINDSFLAGILHRLPLLCGYGMPCQDSFRRLEPLALAGWVSWGTENRDAPLRKIKEGHWELRTIDGTANFYLVLAAFITAGLLGIQEKEPLKWKDNRNFLSRLDGEAREELGINTPLPASLEEAMALCKSDLMGLDSMLGKQILEFYTMVKDGEQLNLAKMTEKEKKEIYLNNF